MLRDERSNDEPQIDFYPQTLEASFRQTKLFKTQRQQANSIDFSRKSHSRYQQPDLEQIWHYAESSNAYLQNIANRTSLNFKKVNPMDNNTLTNNISRKSAHINSLQTDLRTILNQDTNIKPQDAKRTTPHPSQLPNTGGLAYNPTPSRKLSLSTSNGFQQIGEFKRANINRNHNQLSKARQLSDHCQQSTFQPYDNQEQYGSDLSLPGFQVKKNRGLNVDSNMKSNIIDQQKKSISHQNYLTTSLNATVKNEAHLARKDRTWERFKPRQLNPLNSYALPNQDIIQHSTRKSNRKTQSFEEEILLSASKGESNISQLSSIVTQRELDQEMQLLPSRESRNNYQPYNYAYEDKEIANVRNNLDGCNDVQKITNHRTNRSQDIALREISLVKVMGYIHEMSVLNELLAESDKTKNISLLMLNKEFIRNIVNACERVITNEGESCIVEIEKLFKDDKARRIVKQSLIFQRISIVCVAQNLLSSEVFEANFKFIKGIISYATSSFLILTSIIKSKKKVPPSTTSTTSSNQQLISFDNLSQLTSSTTNSTVFSNMYSKSLRKEEANIFKKTNLCDSPTQSQMSNDNRDQQEISVTLIKKRTLKAEKKEPNESSQKIDKQKWVLVQLNQIRQNNELQSRSFKNLSKNDKEFYSFIINFLKQIDKPSSASNHIRNMLEHVSLYFTIKIQQQQQQTEPPIFTIIPSLIISPAPFINLPSSRMYTLFLDLDETLIHCPEAQCPKSTHVSQFLVRPYVQTFLEQLSYFYEIVVFTAGMPDYANWIIDTFDQDHFISHRLYRQHTSRLGDSFVKDLSKSGRDLSKSIIVDNLAHNFSLQNNNGIYIREWTGDPSDTALADLLPLLKEIAVSNSLDVREALKQLKEQISKNIQSGVEFPHLNLKLSK